MKEHLRKYICVFMYCLAFLLTIVSAVPAGAVTDGWVTLLGTTATDYGYGVAVDASGAIYVAGTTYGNLGGETNAGGADIFLAKYDSTGARQWVKLLGTAANDTGVGVATDSAGNIYVTGGTQGNLGGEANAGLVDIFLAKYDGSGTIQWVKLLGTADGDAAYGVAVDSADNVYITGETQGNLGGEAHSGSADIFLAKYDSAGARQWVKLLGTADADLGRSVAVDASGAIYVTGITYGNLGGEANEGDRDIFLAKYDSAGARQWVKLLGTAARDDGIGVAVDSYDSIYVTGETAGDLGGEANAGDRDIFLAKYDITGAIQWVTLLGTAARDDGIGVAVDSYNNIYITGETAGDLGGETNAGGADIFLAKYDTAGARRWVRLLGTATEERGYNVDTDSSGTIYVAGYTDGDLDGETNAGDYDIVVWKNTETSGGGGSDDGSSCFIDSAL